MSVEKYEREIFIINKSLPVPARKSMLLRKEDELNT